MKIIEANLYENDTEYYTVYTTEENGKYPLCKDNGGVFWGNRQATIECLFVWTGVPHRINPNEELCVLEIDNEFGLYNANMSCITRKYAFIEDLMEEMKERDLKPFSFDFG